MAINKGLIWTFYDSSYQCYLFDKWNLNCIWMILTPFLIIGFILTIIILHYRFIINYEYNRKLKWYDYLHLLNIFLTIEILMSGYVNDVYRRIEKNVK